MARTVEKILKDDEDKADLGVTKDELEALDADDTAASEVAAQPTAQETADDLRKQLKETQEKLDHEATARKEAEARATTASNTAGNAVQSQIATQRVAIENRAVAAQTNLESIKQQLKQAKAAQDGDAEVELQDALTNARYELNAAEWDKKKFAEWELAQKNKPAAVTRTPGGYTAQEQAWIDAHPQFKTSKKFARITKAAAADAEQNGHAVDSAGYFRFIEESLREEGLLTDDDEPLSGAGRNTNGASSSVAAAPDRTGNGSAPTVNKNAKYPYIPNGFRIPSEWVQAAQDQGFEDPREYANDRLKIEAEDKGRA